MTNFFFLGGKWMSPKLAQRFRKERELKASVFCQWCISKGVRHTNDCPTRSEGFDPETVPFLTSSDRENLIQQKNESQSKKPSDIA